MNTSSFLAGLRASSHLPLVFRAGRKEVNPGYHLTEVKRVSYETMDCGAMTHRWSESQFEIWAPTLVTLGAGRGHMPAAKFLQIVDRVDAELPLNREATARILASFDGQPAALSHIDGMFARDGTLGIELSGDRTRCKAAERKLASVTGGCCGTGANQPEEEKAAAGCGCGTAKAETAVACCA